jgi:hypothetical protein
MLRSLRSASRVPLWIALVFASAETGCRHEAPQDRPAPPAAGIAVSRAPEVLAPPAPQIDFGAAEAAVSSEPDADARACEPEMAMGYAPGAYDR